MVTNVSNVGHAPPVEQRDQTRLDTASREFLDVFQRDKRIVAERDRNREERRRREEAPAQEEAQRRRPAGESLSQPPNQAVQGEISRRLAARNALSGQIAGQIAGQAAGQGARAEQPADPRDQAPVRSRIPAPPHEAPARPPLVARGPIVPQPPLAGGAPPVASPPPRLVPEASPHPAPGMPLFGAPARAPAARMAGMAQAGEIAGAAASRRPGAPRPAAAAGAIGAPVGDRPVAAGLSLNRATPPEVSERVHAFLSGAPLDQKPFHLQPIEPLVEAKRRPTEAPSLGSAAAARPGAARNAPVSPLARLLSRAPSGAAGLVPDNDATPPSRMAADSASRVETRVEAPGGFGLPAANDEPAPPGLVLFQEVARQLRDRRAHSPGPNAPGAGGGFRLPTV